MDEAPRIEELPPDGTALAAPAASRGQAAAVRLGGMPARVLRSSILVAALVALAVVKPWSSPDVIDAPAASGGSAPSTSGTAPPSTGRALANGPPTEAPAASPLPPGAVACGTPRGWRLVTVGRLAGRPVEGLSVVDPVAGAAGPTDPRIPLLPAGQAPLAAAGACRPLATTSVADDRTDRPPALVVGAWRLIGRAAEPVPLMERGPAAATS